MSPRLREAVDAGRAATGPDARRNCGRIIYTDSASGVTSVVGHMPGEPIVSEEDFDAVSPCIRPAVAVVRTRRHYLCSGIAICGVAGLRSSRCTEGRVNNMKPYPDGAVHRQYWCGRKATEDAVASHRPARPGQSRQALTIEILADPRHADAIEATARELESEASRLDLAIAEAESVAEALSDRLGRGDITLSRYDIAIRPLDERIAKLKTERAALGGPSPQRPPRASREHWQRRWAAADQKEKRALLRMALRGRRFVVAPAGQGFTSRSGRRHPPDQDRVGVFTRPPPGCRRRQDAPPAWPPRPPAARSTAATRQPPLPPTL